MLTGTPTSGRVTGYGPIVTQDERPQRGRRRFATFAASWFVAMGTSQLVVGLITAFKDHDERTVTGAVFMVFALLLALFVRWRKWPRIATDNKMRPTTARQVLVGLTAVYALLAVLALIEGVVDHRGIVAVQVIAFGALALAGGRVLTKSSRRLTP